MRWFGPALGFYQLRQGLYFIMQAPLIVLSSLFMGMFATLAFRALTRLDKVGAKLSWYGLIFSLSQEYLRESRRGRWSPWVVYAMWLCLGTGILIFIAGIVRL